jgi:hypothetical protein
MKTNQASILLYGHEEQLLATRQWVLQSRGYRVVTMMDLEGLASVPSTPPVRLLLLCHTLSAEEATAAIDAVSARWPRAQSLTLAYHGRAREADCQGGRDTWQRCEGGVRDAPLRCCGLQLYSNGP